MPGGVLSRDDDGVSMHLGSLTDEEIISLVRTRDELIVTDLEKELAARLTRAADNESEDNEDLAEQVRKLEDRVDELEDRVDELNEENRNLADERDRAEQWLNKALGDLEDIRNIVRQKETSA